MDAILGQRVLGQRFWSGPETSQSSPTSRRPTEHRELTQNYTASGTFDPGMLSSKFSWAHVIQSPDAQTMDQMKVVG